VVHNLVWLRAEFEPSGLLVNKHMPHRKAKAHAVNEEDPERDRATHGGSVRIGERQSGNKTICYHKD